MFSNKSSTLEWRQSISDTNYQLTDDLNNEIKSKISREFEIEKELGKGNYGTVFKSKYLKTGEIVAIKISSSVGSGTRYYNTQTGKSCCLSGCQPICATKSNIVPTETYALMKARNIKGVIKLKGAGIVLEPYGSKIAFYVTVMEYIDDSITGNKFGTCLRRAISTGKTKMAFNFIKTIMKKLHDVNNELYKINIYHNDLKSDNVLISYTKLPRYKRGANKKRNKCHVDLIEGGHVELYLIDFGNAVTKNENDSKFLVTPRNIVATFLGTIAPDIKQVQDGILQKTSVNKLLSWYLGAFLFELFNGNHVITLAKKHGLFTVQQQQQQVADVVPYQKIIKRQGMIINQQQEFDSLLSKILNNIIKSDVGIKQIAYEFLKQTLKINPNERIHFQEITKTSLFSKI